MLDGIDWRNPQQTSGRDRPAEFVEAGRSEVCAFADAEL